MEEPLYNRRFSDQFGTMYTVEIDPVSKEVHYHWPEGRHMALTPESPEMEIAIPLIEK